MQDEKTQALIEEFLAETEGAVSSGTGATADWREAPLPEGHKSGFVAIIGRPNVGKSTLLNAFLGEKIAIVSPKPQTTRTRLSGILTRPESQLIFIDTPGIHENPAHKLNKVMIEQAVSAIPDADVILFVVDVSVKPHAEDLAIAELLAKKSVTQPIIFVLNKMDKLPLPKAQQRVESYWELLPNYVDSIPTSALNGTNIELLLEHLMVHIPEGPRYYPGNQITDQTEYQIAAELIREAVLHYTHQEVPHSTAILVEDIEARENGMTYIAARIWVERPSQKPILIGKQGQHLKRIGTEARQELERFIGGQVYLDLWVKVKPKWRDHDARLRELGLT
ncbi:MAG: GTPase Era [Anaerolineae bacterium]|nr:GTPase Era [Anaerolineae bacterium]